MKRTLLSIFSLLLTVGLVAQCTPDYDFGDEGFGVSPDPEQGETFVDGEAGMAYSDVIHLKVPNDAGEVNVAYTGVPVDSVSLESVLMSQNGGALLPAGTFGFEVECNNSGLSPNECTFIGGQQGCAEISGTPEEAAEFEIEVQLIFHIQFNGSPFQIPFNYDGYTLSVAESTSIEEREQKELNVAQNYPNPFSDLTEISVELSRGGDIELHVKNLIGEEVMTQQMSGIRGQNKFEVNAQGLNPGIYIYSIEFEGSSVTKRMIVGK